MAARAFGWRQTPPAIFPPIFGLFGLVLAWRAAAEVLAVPAGISDLLLGAVTLLFLAAAATWLAKPLARPAVLAEDLRVLPGQAGVAALVLSIVLLAAGLVPFAPGLARALLILAVPAQVALGLWVLVRFATGPQEARVITPVWHLVFVGYILGPLAAVPLGHVAISGVVLAATLPLACAIWGVSLWQIARRVPPAPLRPLLAMHLAPASVCATVAMLLGMPMLALVLLAVAALIFLALLVFARWIVAGGFSPLWGAFTFPLAAFASALLRVSDGQGWLAVAAAVVLAAATLAVPAIAVRILRGWFDGSLAGRTNAARA